MRDEQKNLLVLDKGFQVADIFTNRQYLDHFAKAEILNRNQRAIYAKERLRMFKMSKVVFDKEEDVTDKLISVYNALYNLSVTVGMFVRGTTSHAEIYFATRSENIAPLAGKVMEATLKGNFPGIDITPLDNQALQKFQAEIDRNSSGLSMLKSLATVSMIPAIRNKEKKEQFVQGMEKFINTMRGKEYVAVLLATPLTKSDIKTRRHGYEEMYSALSPHAKLTYAYGENLSHAVTNGITESFNRSVSESVSNSNSKSTSNTEGTSHSSSSGSSFSYQGWGSNDSSSNSSSSSYTSSQSFSQSISNSVSRSEGESRNRGTTDTKGSSETKTLNFENKGISDLMKRIEEQLHRISTSESYGLWESCAYFFSNDISTSMLAAATYKSLMTGEKTYVENAHVNAWNSAELQGDSIKTIMEHVKNLIHPSAELKMPGYAEQIVTPTSLVSGSEIALLLGMPRKSVSGVAVQEMAEFGRDVVYENKIPEFPISIGNIYHMGIEEDNCPVNMDLRLFSSHCFITGSSGSGKSYATYNLLDRLLSNGVKMLVIEPAKGEYKMVFGKLSGISIFSTDANSYRLLRINPFEFPQKIHVLSHVEQLLQIFNASWPLYAAMPAILKEAVVGAYVKCGWDLKNSVWIKGVSDHKFPTFKDVLKILPEIINTSDYSADSKGDYKGALLTRVQAMTTGLNGLLFKNSVGIPDSILFDENAVVDLSEVGSEETVALIMGVLIMRLGEYRKSQRKFGASGQEHDSNLSHITVLEEAHNLLKRTSKDQSQDGANMVGKSVEMISNSIKEMRTYGEGFLIIDQSPLAVDSSVIENTSTKIIMNTPSKEACEELGNALSLNERQIKELSRLNVGIAAVMQKGWMSPVLMRIGKWNASKYEAPLQQSDFTTVKFIRSQLTEELLRQASIKKFSPIAFNNIIMDANVTADRREELNELYELYNRLKKPLGLGDTEIGILLMEIIGCENLFDIIPTKELYTGNQFIEITSAEEEDEEDEIYNNLIKTSRTYVRRIENALDEYVSVDDEIKRKALTYMVAYKGDKGNADDSVFGLLYNVLTSNKLD